MSSKLTCGATDERLHRSSDVSLGASHLLVTGLYDDDDAQQRKSSISFDKIKQISLTYSLQDSEDETTTCPTSGQVAADSPRGSYCAGSPSSDTRKPSVIEVPGAKWTPFVCESKRLQEHEQDQQQHQHEQQQQECRQQTNGLERRLSARYADTNPFASPYDSDQTNSGFSEQRRAAERTHQANENKSRRTPIRVARRQQTPLASPRHQHHWSRANQRSSGRAAGENATLYLREYEQWAREQRQQSALAATATNRRRPENSNRITSRPRSVASDLSSGSLGLRVSRRHNSISLVVFGSGGEQDSNIIISDHEQDESCSDESSVWPLSGRLAEPRHQRQRGQIGEYLSGEEDEGPEVEVEDGDYEQEFEEFELQRLDRDQNWQRSLDNELDAGLFGSPVASRSGRRDLHLAAGRDDRDRLAGHPSSALDFVCELNDSPMRLRRRPMDDAVNHESRSGRRQQESASYERQVAAQLNQTSERGSRARDRDRDRGRSRSRGQNGSVYNQEAAQSFAGAEEREPSGGQRPSDKSLAALSGAVIGHRSTGLDGNGNVGPQATATKTTTSATIANDASAYSLASHELWPKMRMRQDVDRKPARETHTASAQLESDWTDSGGGRRWIGAHNANPSFPIGARNLEREFELQQQQTHNSELSPRRRRIDIVIGSPHRDAARTAGQLEANWSSLPQPPPLAGDWAQSEPTQRSRRNNNNKESLSHLNSGARDLQHSSASSGGSLGGWSNYGIAAFSDFPTIDAGIRSAPNGNAEGQRSTNRVQHQRQSREQKQKLKSQHAPDLNPQPSSNHYLANEISLDDSRRAGEPADANKDVVTSVGSTVISRPELPLAECQPAANEAACEVSAVAQVDVRLKQESALQEDGSKSTSKTPTDTARCPLFSTAPPSSRPLKLRNLLSDEQSVDSLHTKYRQNNKSHGCNETRCLGSMLNPRPVENKVRSAAETLDHARDFINNFYASIKRTDSPAHKARLAEIEEQLRTSETYYLKETELIYGAKLAWRNASRCIGRIQWSKLQVFDARFTTNANEMFEALCNHIKYATNKGSLRSAITILPQRVKSTKNDWRIWNSQLIGYAGYRDKDTGKVTGDPANVEMTEVCERLGWRGKGTRFDVLPLVLSANGQPPQLFPLPEELVLRVKIKHPKYKWFEELGLEWYALPAVSSMMLDVGGLQFTAAPFSGWYMVTEIGTRDLGDTSRYNVLEDVAQRMGLNTTSNMSLWKDQAVVELNIAVLDSFQAAGVTIVDHHTASETFMTHLANEQRLRGGCPADWVWLVPPTSGSTTQVFHQEMVNYHLLPNYEYLDPCWRGFDWAAWEQLQRDKLDDAATRKRLASISPGARASPNGLALSPSGRSVGSNLELTPRKIRFKEIARAVKFTSKLFGKALSRRIKATILYATETGKSERFANKLAQTFSCAFNVHLMSMSDYDLTCLEHEALLLVVTSTFGNGDPPENGELFAKHLAAVKLTGDTSPDIDSINSVSTNPFFQMLSEDHKDASLSAEEREDELGAASSPRQDKQEQQTNIRPLSNVRFGVFALGSTAYPHFCAFGRYVDQTLGELGAERILKCSTGDELCGQEKAFNEWSSEVFRTACDVFCLSDSIGPIEERPELVWSPHDVKFVPVEIIGDSPPSRNSLLNGTAPIQLQKDSVSEQTVAKSSELLSSKKTIIRNLMSFTNKKIIPFTVRDRRDLHSFNPDENLQTLCLDLESDWISGPGMTNSTANIPNNQASPAVNRQNSALIHYEAGDHVAIYPTNKTDMVEKILLRMREDLTASAKANVPALDFDQVYTILVKRESMDLTPAAAMAQGAALGGENNWITHDRLPVTSIREALTRYLDITSPPNQEFLSILARLTSDQDERKRLQQMARNFTIYEEWKNKRVPALLSAFEEFKTIKFEPALVTQIPLIKPRFYSVSGTFSLTVGVVRFKTATGELREGLCSNYLNTVPMDPKTFIYGYIRSAQAFHMPLDKSIPMILISAGTGIAPFRSFWQQRYADMYKGITQQQSEMKQKVATAKTLFGRMDMYFGCRNSNYILYKDELDTMYENGVLSSVNIAFSRPSDCDVENEDWCDASIRNSTVNMKPISKIASIKQARRKMYVQDKLLEDSDDIYRLIMLDGAHLYVCGDVAMADGVYKTLATIINNSFKANKLSEKCDPPSADSAIDSGLSGDLAKSSEDGESVLMNLRNLNRYHEDIFGAKQMS